MSRWERGFGFANADHITIDDLLCHTSGIFSFQADPSLRARPGYKSPAEVLAAARAHPAAFCPGAAWDYSNTGYTLLGRILEIVDSKPFVEALTARIINRLGLIETEVVRPGVAIAGLSPPVNSGPASGADDDIATPGAAGPIAASAADMVRAFRGLMEGRLHSRDAVVARFQRLYPMFGGSVAFYGRGVMLSDLSRADPNLREVWLGHAGGLPGAGAVVVWSNQKRAYAAAAWTGDGSAEATANRLLSALADA